MTYLVLARKWRPRSFDTLVGQDHVVRALTHALDTQRLHHAWLFTGTRGVGKTTLSRILAKSLNCEQGITARPCGQCRACTEIDAGRYVDYVELDAASNRGVDEMTQLLEQAVYAPSSARFKVYMIDEVHMLTGHAFNAMLKTLEEPPPHVKFILATTDPQKIPVTVLSRCLQFNLKHMTVESIVDHLQLVLNQEGLGFEVPALRLLGQAAGGSMRDALSLTDQAIAYSAGNLTLEAVQGMLGTIDQRHLVRLLQALSVGQATGVLAVADELASRGLSYTGALADLAVMLSHIAIEQRVPGTLPEDDPLTADIEALAKALHPDLLQLYYSIAVHSRNELALAPDEYAGFVMACLRMLALTPESAHLPEPPRPDSKRIDAAQRPPANQPAAAPADASHATQSDASQGNTTHSPASHGNSAPATVAEPSAEVARDTGPDVPAWEDLPPDAANPPLPETVEKHASAAPRQVGDSIVPERPSHASTAESSALGEEEPRRVTEATEAETTDSVAVAAEPVETEAPVHADADFDFVPDYDPPEYGEGDWEPVIDGDMGDGDMGAADIAAASLSSAGLAPLIAETDATTTRTPRLARMTPEDWPSLAASLPLTGLADELARQSEWVSVKDDIITLRVAIWSLAAKQGQARLCTVLTEHFGKVVKLNIQFGETGTGTARAVEEARRAERQREAEVAVANDPLIHSLIEEFGAQVIPGTIAAVDERAA